MIHAAIFDMDGILFDTERLCCEAWKKIADAKGYPIEDDLFLSCVGRNNKDTKEIIVSALGRSFPYDEFSVLTRKLMQDKMDLNGPPPKPGVQQLLDFLSSLNIPIALATSTTEKTARWMISRGGLESYFSVFAFGNEVKQGKPAPDIFLLAKNRLEELYSGRCIDASFCMVFEDSPAGIRAAHAAGMKPVFIPDLVDVSPEVLDLVWKKTDNLANAACKSFYSQT